MKFVYDPMIFIILGLYVYCYFYHIYEDYKKKRDKE